MRTFKDHNQREWQLADIGVDEIEAVRTQAKVDLCDITGDVFTRLEADDVLLRDVLKVLCSCDPSELSKGLKRDGITRALEAVRGAVEDFFPPKRWSELQSNLDRRREADDTFRQLRPMLEMLGRPEVPQSLREGVMVAIREMVEGSIASRNSTAPVSATGPLANLLNAVSDSPDLSASIPAA